MALPELLLRDGLALRERRAQACRLGGPRLRRRRGSIQREADQPAGFSQHVLEREHRAPRSAEQVDLFEPQLVADGWQLVEEEVERPELRVVGAVRVSAAELVVEDHQSTPVRQPLERLEVVVRRAGPAVEAEQRVPVLRADVAVPGLEAAEGNPPLDRFHSTSGSNTAG